MASSLANIGSAVLLTAWATAPAADANAVIVTNAAQLTSALASAHGGDTIRLAPGVYSDLGRLRGLNYPSRVTITSVDAAHPAVITPFYMYDSSNILFDHVEFSAAGSTDPHAYRVYGSKNIAFDHDVFHGNMDAPPPTEPMNGITFFQSSNVSITNSEFTHLDHGIGNAATNGANFSNNSFYEMRCDGMDITSSNNIHADNNVFTEFHISPGDHPDAIQLWGDGSHDISISGNLVVRGDGGAPIQGVFFNDNPGWVHNVTVSNNYIIGGGYNAIDVTGGVDVIVASNTVAAYAGQESWIRLENSVGVKLSDNISLKYINHNNSKVSQAANKTTGYVSDGGKALVNKWLAEHSDWSGTLPASVSHLLGAAHASARAQSGGVDSGPHAVVGRSFGALAVVGSEARQNGMSFDPVLFDRAISGLALPATAASTGL